MHWISILVLLVFFCLTVIVGCSGNNSGKTVQQNSPTATNVDSNFGVMANTDRRAYSKGQVIKVSIQNDTEECIASHILSLTPVFSIQYVEKEEPSGSWQQMFAYCQPPYCEYDMDAPGEIAPGETASFEWQPLIYPGGKSEAEQLPEGAYRLSITYEDCAKTEWKSVRTNELLIE